MVSNMPMRYAHLSAEATRDAVHPLNTPLMTKGNMEQRPWARKTKSPATARLLGFSLSGGGGNRTRVRKPSALRPYVRSPRFATSPRLPRTGFLEPVLDRSRHLGSRHPRQPARIMTVDPNPTGRELGDRALRAVFRQPARAQRCRWLLCLCRVGFTSYLTSSARVSNFLAPVETRSPPVVDCLLHWRSPRRPRLLHINR